MNHISDNQTSTLHRTARNMFEAAVAVTTGQMHLSSPNETAHHLRNGQPDVLDAFRSQLARQVAAALLMLDPYITAVYEERAQQASDRKVVDLRQPLRLWIIARHRSVTLYTAIDELNIGLAEAMSSIIDDAPATVVQTIVVDERDGYLLRGQDFWYGQEPVLLSSRETPQEPTRLSPTS